MRLIVIYDSCVLYSAALRDLLLHLAAVIDIRVHWSDDIHEEWIRNLLHNRPDLKRERLERTRQNMNKRFRLSLVKDYEAIIPMLHLPDPNDRHVLAAAIHSEASLIVTENLKDFPKSALARYHIEAVTPDEFVCRLIKTHPRDVLAAAKLQRLNLKNPPKTVTEHLATLEQHLPQAIQFLREHQAEI
jgi:predicted nucleic acid-binding protein